MHFRNAISGLIFCWLLIGLAGTAESSRIPIGLGNTGVWLQEYWVDHTPYYWVFNPTDSTISLDVREFRKNASWWDKLRKYDRIIDTWNIPPGQVGYFEVSELIGLELVEVGDSPPRGGYLDPPVEPPKPASKKIATFGTFCIGGGRKSESHWVQQDSLVFERGGAIEVELVVGYDKGRVVFGSRIQLWRIASNKTEGHPHVDKDVHGYPIKRYEPRWLSIKDVKCESLRVEYENELYVVHMSEPIKNQDYHTIKLSFVMPKPVFRNAPSLNIAEMGACFIFDESQRKSWISRGFIIEY